MLVAFLDVEVEDSGLQWAVAVGDLAIQTLVLEDAAIQTWAHEGSEAQTWVLVGSEFREHRAACSAAAAMDLVDCSEALAGSTAVGTDSDSYFLYSRGCARPR